MKYFFASSGIQESLSALDAVRVSSGTTVVVLEGELSVECALTDPTRERRRMFREHMLRGIHEQ